MKELKEGRIIHCKIQPSHKGYVETRVVHQFRLVKYKDYRNASRMRNIKWTEFYPDKLYDAEIHFAGLGITLMVVKNKNKKESNGFKFMFHYGSREAIFKDWSLVKRRVLIEKTGHIL